MRLSDLKQFLLGTPLEYPARWILQRIHSTSPPINFKTFNLPYGFTEMDLWNVFLSFSIGGEAVGHLDPYVKDSFYRFIHTWELVRYEKGKCLELGANPYFITWLLKEHTELDVTIANYFGVEEHTGRQTLSWMDGKSRKEVVFEFDHFNAEESRFPYGDSCFDLVLYCEIIEHLLMNPVHTLKEIHRVLKPSGLLVVTTPNVARLGNIIAIAEGKSIYDPYSGFGPYGRHNREFSMTELLHLLNFCGFEHEKSFTADAHKENWSTHPLYPKACSITETRQAYLGQYLFGAVRRIGTPREGLPATLFRSYEGNIIDPAW